MSGKAHFSSTITEEDEPDLGPRWKPREFSEYLTKSGVSAALADAVLELWRVGRTDDGERPADPIEFIRSRMRPDNEDRAQIELYSRRLEALQAKADETRAETDRLLRMKRRLADIYGGDECDDDNNSHDF